MVFGQRGQFKNKSMGGHRWQLKRSLQLASNIDGSSIYGLSAPPRIALSSKTA